jgi:putative Holliday junction resolvase
MMAEANLASSAGRGRILGLDAGERRIGIAISDPERRFALPLRSVTRDGRGGEFAALRQLAEEEGIDEVVVGLPLSLSGEAGAQAQDARSFADQVESRLKLKVHMYDERLSTQEAMRRVHGEPRGGRRDKSRMAADTDAIAASIILQAYLDRENFAGPAGG